MQKKLDAIGSLDTNLRDCCNKITEEQILENETIFRPTSDRQADWAGVWEAEKYRKVTYIEQYVVMKPPTP